VQLKKLRIENLFRFEKVDIDFGKFPLGATICVLGQNFDQFGANSNGAGKSSIFEVISWVIFGKTLRPSYVSDIVRRGTSAGFARLELNNERYGNVVIERFRKISEAGFKVKLWVNSAEVTGRKNTQELIFKYLGFEGNRVFEDFQNLVLLSRSSIDLFASSKTGAKERIETVRRFLGVDFLGELIILLRDKKAQGLSSRLKVDVEVGQLRAMVNQASESSLLLALENAKSKKNEAVAQQELLENEMSSIQSHLFNLDGALKLETDVTILKNSLTLLHERILGVKSKILAVENVISTSKTVDVEPLNSSISQQEKIVDALAIEASEKMIVSKRVEDDILSLQTELKKQNLSTSSLLRCPVCFSELLLDEGLMEKSLMKFDIEGKAKLRSGLEEKIKALIEKQNLLLVEIGNVRAAFSAAKQSVTSLRDSLLAAVKNNERIKAACESVVSLNDDLTVLSAQWEEKSSSMAVILEQYSEIMSQYGNQPVADVSRKWRQHLQQSNEKLATIRVNVAKFEAEIASIEVSIEAQKQAKVKIDQKEKELAEIDKELNLIETWLVGFPEVSRMVIDSSLPFFEDRVNFYLSELKVTERIKFETLIEKRSAEGEFKSGFNIKVWDGAYWADFDMYSEGERMRIALAVCFGLRDLSSKITQTPVYFFLCDEIADTLDDAGIREFFLLLKHLPEQKFVVSHKVEGMLTNHADDVLTVERRSGVSILKGRAA